MAVYHLFPFPPDHQSAVLCFLQLFNKDHIAQELFVILLGNLPEAGQGEHRLGQSGRGHFAAAFQHTHRLMVQKVIGVLQGRDGLDPMLPQIELNDGYGADKLPVDGPQGVGGIDFQALHKGKENLGHLAPASAAPQPLGKAGHI